MELYLYLHTHTHIFMMWCLLKHKTHLMAWYLVKHRDSFTFARTKMKDVMINLAHKACDLSKQA